MGAAHQREPRGSIRRSDRQQHRATVGDCRLEYILQARILEDFVSGVEVIYRVPSAPFCAPGNLSAPSACATRIESYSASWRRSAMTKASLAAHDLGPSYPASSEAYECLAAN
jgi:hypothetical protein